MTPDTSSQIPAVESPVPTPMELSPSYRLPLGLLVIAGGCAWWLSWWLGGAIALLAMFLAFQTATLRLRFTDGALEIYRGETCLRYFPYADWLHWEIFWSAVPILLYFREVNSIHFLPILFNPAELRTCLEQHCPRASDG